MGRWKTLLDHFVAAAAIGAIAGLGGLAFIYSGLFEAEASKPHSKLIDWATKTTMTHSVRRHGTAIEAPASASAEQVMDGFCQYETHCVACHGGPGVARQSWVNGMTPDPPYLVDARSKWRPRELYWIVRNGIKMTGMPAWEKEMSERQTWDVVAFLSAMPRLPAGTYASWRASGLCGAATPVSAPPLPAPARAAAEVGRSPSRIASRPPAHRTARLVPRPAKPAAPPPPPKNVGPQ